MGVEVVGVIGSGNIGAGVARLATAAGLRVVVSNSRGPETLQELVAELGERASADSPAGAAQQADLVVLAVPLRAYADLPVAALAGKVVVDATNYYPARDGQITELDSAETTSSEIVQRAAPLARVVKALNTVDFVRLPRLARPAGAPDRTALPVAGDDPEAKASAIELLDAIGFDAVDAGSLAEGWRFQPGTPTYVQPYSRPGASDTDDPLRQFLDAEPVPVPASQAHALLDAATLPGRSAS